MTEETESKIKEFLDNLNTDIEIGNYIEIKDIDIENPFNSIFNELREKSAFIREGEVIYYSNAIQYLSENDASLNKSLELADQLEYLPEDLNSEILASLLKTEKITDGFNELKSEIEDFFNNLEIQEDGED